jgi:geranylgeranyl pyrophosphate synthase
LTATLDPASAPAAIRAWLERTRPVIDTAIEARLPRPTDDPGRLAEAMRYAALGAGKRLRPALVLAAAEAAGGEIDRAIAPAVAIELLHAYTLVHDDLPAMDDDDERRGRPTVHVAFGEAIAILAGDGLLTLAFATLAELGAAAADAVAVLGRRAGWGELLAGQARDLALDAGRRGADAAPPGHRSGGSGFAVARGAKAATLAEAEILHAGKTGALFAASCELGAIAAGADAATRSRLARYGLAIGIAFQHADDLDDHDLAHLAAEATARRATLCAEASSIAAALGPRGATLEEVARWIGNA